MRKYLINIEDYSKLEDDIDIFLEEVRTLQTNGYVLPHFFNTHNEITSYGFLIIKTNNLIDLNYLKEVYNIIPNKILKSVNHDIYHTIFELDRGISKNDYLRLGKSLCFILDGEQIDYHFFEEYNTLTLHSSDDIDRELITFLIQFSLQLSNNIRYERTLSKQNFENLEIANTVSLVDIYTKLKLPLKDIDIKKNFHIKFGNPFSFVENYFNSQLKGFEFFNEFFETNFEIDSTKLVSKIMRNGYLIENGHQFYSGKVGYIKLSGEGGEKIITDFRIKVHYKIRKIDGTIIYIVSLSNELSGFESEKINWCNETGRTPFSNYIQKYGDFHFYGTDIDIKNIHKEIANTKNIPYIKNIIGYGFQEEEQIIIFKNGVWDIKEKVFTYKQDKYFFNYNFQGYLVTDNKGNDLSEIIKEGIPELNCTKIINIQDTKEFLKSLYSDDTGLFLLSFALGMFGYLLYGNQNEPFPFFFAKGITSSGKTTFNELLLRMWGINKKGGLDFANCSLFTMSLMLSHLIKLPYYLGEYRRSIPYAAQKEGILRAAFDRKTQQKGRADQSMINYSFFANPIMDGEEVFLDGAVKSRMIQRQFIKKHRIGGNFNDIVKSKGSILDNVLYTYLTKSNKEDYFKGYTKGKKIFHELTTNSTSRIGDNFAYVYAGIYALIGEDEEIKESLIQSCKFQIEDFEKEGTSMQIIKAITQFLDGMPFKGVTLTKDSVIIVWNILDEYIRRNKIQLSLDVETYKEHIIAMGYEVDYIDTGTSMIYGIIIPNNNIPKQFLIHPDFYAAHKQYLLNNPF